MVTSQPGGYQLTSARSNQPTLGGGVPRCAVRTVLPKLARVGLTYSAWGFGGKPPCAGTHGTREAGTRSTYVSAQQKHEALPGTLQR